MINFVKACATAMVVTILAASCGPVAFSRLAGGESTAEVGWDSAAADSRSVMPQGETSTRAVSTAAEVQSFYDAFYQSLGSKVMTVTPTEFSFTSPIVRLSNPGTYYDFRFEKQQTDFADASSARRQVSVNSTYYDSLYLHFRARAQELMDNGTNPQAYQPAVIVTLPGYTGAELADIGPMVTQSGEELYERKYLGGNQFMLTYGELQADLSSFYSTPPGFEMFAEYIIVTANVGGVALVVPDGFTHSTSDYTLNESYGSDTDRPFVLVPWDGVYVDPTKNKATLTVTLDIDGIVEVYDNGTPADKSDDRVVLANRFWERFGVSVD